LSKYPTNTKLKKWPTLCDLMPGCSQKKRALW